MRNGYCFSRDKPSCSMHPNAIEVRNVFGCGQLATIAMCNNNALRISPCMYIDIDICFFTFCLGESGFRKQHG